MQPRAPVRTRAAWLAAALAGAALLLAAALALAQQPVPALTARVIDLTATLSDGERGALEAKLAAFEASAGTQIVVLMVATTAPEDIAAYSQRVADSWKIGRRDIGDGLLVVVAKNDRRVRIEVAKALEGAVPDLAARQVIDSRMREPFRAGDYARGLDAAVDALIARIRGEALPEPAPQPDADFGDELPSLLEQLGIFFFVAVPIAATLLTRMFGRRFGSLLAAGGAGAAVWWFTASLLFAVLAGLAALVVVGLLGIGAARRSWSGRGGGSWLPGGVDGGSWSSGGDGGGFSSGGGGDFGGGGASGDW